MEHWNLDIIGYWIIVTACLIEKDLKLSPGPPKFLKLLPCLYLSIGQVWWLNDLWFKGYIQKCNDTYTNTHHDVTDLVNHGMVWNTKTWISWEWNKTFLQNKKIPYPVTYMAHF